MAQIPRTMACNLPGFETYHVTYNMMATIKQVEALQLSIGEGSEYDRSAAIIDYTGWPEAEYPGGPFGENTPLAVLLWTARIGVQLATVESANDPFSQTA